MPAPTGRGFLQLNNRLFDAILSRGDVVAPITYFSIGHGSDDTFSLSGQWDITNPPGTVNSILPNFGSKIGNSLQIIKNPVVVLPHTMNILILKGTVYIKDTINNWHTVTLNADTPLWNTSTPAIVAASYNHIYVDISGIFSINVTGTAINPGTPVDNLYLGYVHTTGSPDAVSVIFNNCQMVAEYYRQTFIGLPQYIDESNLVTSEQTKNIRFSVAIPIGSGTGKIMELGLWGGPGVGIGLGTGYLLAYKTITQLIKGAGNQLNMAWDLEF